MNYSNVSILLHNRFPNEGIRLKGGHTSQGHALERMHEMLSDVMEHDIA